MKDEYVLNQILETVESLRVAIYKIDSSLQHIDTIKWELGLLQQQLKEMKSKNDD